VDRAFPEHSLFRDSMGTGQSALFNCMRAYAVLDDECGYCQGMSFIGGLLLMHLPEAEAFEVLKALMFTQNLRARYMPDMQALQLQLYQLSRLLHDHVPEVYGHFDQHDIEPFLYATPWFLTFFSTSFSVEFAKRVMDAVLVGGDSIIFAVSLSLIRMAASEIAACDSFERTLNFLQVALPRLADEHMDKVMQDATDMRMDAAQLEMYSDEF
ncbi:uncharacterized protein MONBRDRAFT_2868, partial [Monosiga brevicollis MX1]